MPNVRQKKIVQCTGCNPILKQETGKIDLDDFCIQNIQECFFDLDMSGHCERFNWHNSNSILKLLCLCKGKKKVGIHLLPQKVVDLVAKCG